jgi:hypothetical protein
MSTQYTPDGFPITSLEENIQEATPVGLTLLDYFAAHAVSGLVTQLDEGVSYEQVVEDAYTIGVLMVKSRSA